MKQDERDEALGRTLDAAVTGVEPDADRRSGEVRRRGSQRRALRWTASVVVVALFVGTFAYLGFQTRNRQVSVDTSTWSAYEQPTDGWSWKYPSQWHLQEFDEDFGRGSFRGAVVTNVDFAFGRPDSGNTQWDMQGLPEDAVVVQVEFANAGLASIVSGPSTKFPLSLDDARREPHRWRYRYGAPDTLYEIPIRIHGGAYDYTALVWFGDEAGPRDRQVAELIVGSIRFPGTGGWITHHDEHTGASLEIPPDWTVGAEDFSCGSVDFHWMAASNRPADLHGTYDDGSSCGTTNPWEDIPSDLAALEIEWLGGGPAGLEYPPDATFPLSRDGGQEERVEKGAFRGYVTSIPVHSEDGLHISVRTLIGDDASPLDIAALDRVLSSILIPELSEEPADTGRVSYQHPTYPWAFEYPAGWTLDESTVACRQTITTVRVTSPPGNSHLGHSIGDCIEALIGLNSQVVEVRIEHRVEGPPAPADPSRPDTTFPLSDEDIIMLDHSGYGDVVEYPIWRHGRAETWVVVFLGSDAPAAEVERAREVLDSLRIGPVDPPVERPRLVGNGFEVTYPVAWNAWTEGVDCKTSSRWLVVSSRGDQEDTHRYTIDGNVCEFRLRQDHIAFDAVIVELVHRVTDADGLDDLPAEPLKLEDAVEADAGSFDGRVYELDVVASDHATYTLRVYIGKGATAWDIDQVDAILASLVIEPWA